MLVFTNEDDTTDNIWQYSEDIFFKLGIKN